jgi:hypothetical protein
MDKLICFDINDELLFNLDSYILKMKKDKPKQHYSRKKIIALALVDYLKFNNGTEKVNYFKIADEKLAQVFKK